MAGKFHDAVTGEPTLADLLADPVTHHVMARDGLTLSDVCAACAVGRRLVARRRAQLNGEIPDDGPEPLPQACLDCACGPARAGRAG